MWYVVTVCATVSTGLKSVAVSECREKLDCKSMREGRGRVYFDIPTIFFFSTKTPSLYRELVCFRKRIRRKQR